MNTDIINDYLAQAREIIGRRSRAEIEYDNALIVNLENGMDIQSAVRAANRLHPTEALQPTAEQWDDVAERYDYLMEHKKILKRLGMKEES